MGTSRKGPGREILVMGPEDRYGCGGTQRCYPAPGNVAVCAKRPNMPVAECGPGLATAVAWRRATTRVIGSTATNRDSAEAWGKG
jgi:hypothetical protein